jgi:serine/threonine-protein kinase
VIGESFGNYRVVRVLGQGGMGVVYLAEHQTLGRRAVIKQLLPEVSRDHDIVQRFFNEARAATMIRHPGIVDVFDFGQHPTSGTAYIVMEFLEGESLASRLERERILPIDLAAYIARQIASPLGAAHAVGIVHRDLKPDNVYLSPDPDAPYGIRVKVLDFGIAKLAGQLTTGGVKTRTGAVMGTPTYMAPEQCHGAADLDHRADLYALGCILFEMVCGRPPFVGQGLGEILGAHMFQEPPRPSTIARVPPQLDELILHLLAKAPASRPPSTEPVIAALDAIRRGIPGAQMAPSASVMVAQAPTAIAHSSPHVVAPITTLGGAAGAVVSAPPVGGTTMPVRAPKRWLLPVAGGAIAATAVVVAIVATRGGGGGKAAAGSGSGSASGSAGTGSGSASASAGSATPAGSAADEACDHGDGARCVEAGLAALGGASPQASRARDLFDKGCTIGTPAACGQLAHLLLQGADGVKVDTVRGLSAATRGCDGKDGLACATLAFAAAWGTGMSPDASTALRAGEAACDAGAGDGCTIASDVANVAGDAAKAGALAKRGLPMVRDTCAGGDDQACISFDELAASGRAGERPLAEAAKLLQIGCDRGGPMSCLALANAYEYGIGVAPDATRARELGKRAGGALAAACDLGRLTACARLGRVLASDDGSSRDPMRAAGVLQRACDGGSGVACMRLARMTAIGDGPPKDADKADELYRRARTQLEQLCNSYDETACTKAGGLYARGNGGRPDLVRAVELFHRACTAGDTDGCMAWAASDHARELDGWRATAALADPACVQGDLPACLTKIDVRCRGPKALADAPSCVPMYHALCASTLAGCNVLGLVQEAGVGGKPDKAAALATWTAACDKGDGASCNSAGIALVDAHKYADAAAKFTAGCDARDGSSCANLADLVHAGLAPIKGADHEDALRRRACVLGFDGACR